MFSFETMNILSLSPRNCCYNKLFVNGPTVASPCLIDRSPCALCVLGWLTFYVAQAVEKDGTVVQTLSLRRQVILDNIRDNDESGTIYQKVPIDPPPPPARRTVCSFPPGQPTIASIFSLQEIEVNEKQRRQLQDMIEEAISSNGNRTYLHILSQYRLLVSAAAESFLLRAHPSVLDAVMAASQGMTNTELQFEIAMRDQIIHNQREAQRNLWSMLLGLGLDQKQLMELAARQGVTIEDWTAPSIAHQHRPDLRAICRMRPQQKPAPGTCELCPAPPHSR